MSEHSCSTCFYWKGDPNDAPGKHCQGLCRRWPPERREPYAQSFHPTTYGDGWCGEHKERSAQ